MLEWIGGGEILPALINVVSLALWTALPTLLLTYCWQLLAARHIRPEFPLRRSEAAELNRALLLYQQVRGRLKDINDRSGGADGFWRAIFARWFGGDLYGTDEREDLEAHADHLRAIIVGLRRRPLRRLRTWVHVMSLRFALGHALWAHIAVFALLLLAFYRHGQSASTRELTAAAHSALIWYPFDQRIFEANAAAAGFAAVLSPLLYLLRRVGLRRGYALEFRVLGQLADTDPEQKIEQSQTDTADSDDILPGSNAAHTVLDQRWFVVLGVAQSAAADQVKEAYRTLIKQNHPDRVRDMSPAIRNCAEAETKKLNAAYRQALASLA